MRIKMVYKLINTRLRYLIPVLATGLIAIGPVSAVSADHGRDYRNGPGHQRNANYYEDRRHRGNKRGHFMGRRGDSNISSYRSYRPYPVQKVTVIHHYYREPEPVYIERHRVIEHRRYVEPAPVYQYGAHYGPSGSSLIGAAIGGLLGSRVGKGDGKLAATAGGAVTGYMLGSHH